MLRFRAATLALLLVGGAAGSARLAGQEGQDAEPSGYVLRTLESGAELIVVPDLSAERVTVTLLLRGGTSADPPRLAGVGSLTAQILTHSTRNRTRQELGSALDGLGADLGAVAEADFTAVSLSVGASDLAQGLALMADVVLNPVLPADQLAARGRRASRVIELQSASPEFQASRALIRGLYDNHPYGIVETRETLGRIDVQDAVRYHRDFYRPNNAAFVVAGAVEPDAVAALLNDRFREWRPRPLSLPTYYGLPEVASRRIVLVHMPGEPVAVIRAGTTVLDGSDPGWPALQVANRVLGADPGAWLATALDTLAPQAASTLSRRADVGSFAVRFETDPDAVGEAIRIMLDRIGTLGEPGPGSGELDYRKTELVAEAERARGGTRGLANLVTQHLLLGRDRAEIEEFAEHVRALQVSDVGDAARRSLNPHQLLIVIAGDATRVAPQVVDLGVTTIIDGEGRTLALDGLADAPPSLGLDATGLIARTWTYRVQSQGMQVGEVTRRLRRGDVEATWRLESEARIGPRSVDRTVTFRADSFLPLSSEDDLRVGPQRMHSALTLDGGRVTGTLSIPGAEQAVESAAAPGALLGEMVEAALWVMDLEARDSFGLPVIGQDGATVEVTVSVLGTQTVAVPAGTFETYEVEVVGAGQNQRLFLTRDVPRQTIKIELNDQPVETILDSVRDGSD